MRKPLTLLAGMFALALAVPVTGCQPQEEEFEETPAAEEEVEIMEEDGVMEEDTEMMNENNGEYQ